MAAHYDTPEPLAARREDGPECDWEAYWAPEPRSFVVVGVWLDGVPTDLTGRLTYPEALAEHAAHAAKRIPFVGILDEDDPERGYGPWDD